MALRRKGSILCPNCRKLISTDESQCPYCRTSRPASWLKSNILTQRMMTVDSLIRAVITANASLYIISILLSPRSGAHFGFFSGLSPSDKTLFLLGATGVLPIDEFNRWWTLVSANYLHVGILHILFNMLAFRQIAGLSAQEYGVYRTITIYTVGGVVGFVISYLAGVPFTIGASGAVCSLIGAVLYFGKARGGTYGQAVYGQIGGWAIGIFLFGLLVPGINNWAHGGGMVSGFFLGLLLGYQERGRETLLHRLLGVLCMAVTLVVLTCTVALGVLYRL